MQMVLRKIIATLKMPVKFLELPKNGKVKGI